jgi:2-dehydro-3-deoxyphosphogluconate aldolase / (4S)-4-hydroxy-2-oxoglutarate aldolase
LVERFGGSALIGAGTVLTPAEVDAAVNAGARYIVAPNTNVDVINRSLELGALPIPGAYTPTEIEFAYRSGAGMVKLFPSMPVGPAYLKNIRGPFPHIPIMCTGGIDIEDAPAFLKAGANAVGMSGTLVNADVTKPGGLERLRERASRVIALVNGLEVARRA